MSEPLELEALYAQAHAALKAKDLARARDLLRQIVVADETYRDASRLLANVIAAQRRRWYNDPRLWGAVGVVILIALGIVLASVLPALLPAPTPTMVAIAPTATATSAPTATATAPAALPTLTATPTRVPGVTPTPAALTWKRISQGQEFPREVVMALAVDPRDPEVMYAGGAYSGIFKTVDGGESWFPAHLGLEHAAVNTLTLDPQDPRTIYAGITSGDVYKTTDGGESWQASKGMAVATWDWLSQVVIDPRDSKHLYYAADTVYESNDAGATWQKIKKPNCPDSPAHAFVIDPKDSKTLFWAVALSNTTCQSGVYKSTDGGVTWTLTELQGGLVGQYRSLVIDSKSGNILYVNKSPGGLYKSTDAGNTWNRVFGNCRLVAIQPGNSEVVYCGTDTELNQSVDGGQTWRKLNVGARLSRSLVYLPQSSTHVFLGGQGVFFSGDNGATWQSRSQGLGNVLMNLTMTPNSLFYATETFCTDYKANHALYNSGDGGRTWKYITSEHCGFALDADGTTLYRLDYNQVFRSQDGGTTWAKVGPVWNSNANLAAHPRQKGMLFVSGNEAQGQTAYFRFSTDGGNTWQNAAGIIPKYDSASLAFDHDQGQVVYSVSSSTVHRSTDGGKTWAACGGSNMRPTSGSESRAVVDPRDRNRIIVAARVSGVAISADGCKTWQASNTGLVNRYVNTIAVDRQNPDRLYAGTDGGAFVSFDGGKSWNQINEGLLGALVIYSIAVDPKDASVYASTPYGIFKLENR